MPYHRHKLTSHGWDICRPQSFHNISKCLSCIMTSGRYHPKSFGKGKIPPKKRPFSGTFWILPRDTWRMGRPSSKWPFLYGIINGGDPDYLLYPGMIPPSICERTRRPQDDPPVHENTTVMQLRKGNTHLGGGFKQFFIFLRNLRLYRNTC